MKKTLLFISLCAINNIAAAGGYKFLNLQHPQISSGAFLDLKTGHSAGGAVLALVTHSRTSTNIFSSLVDGWAPATLGGTIGKGLGGPSVALGTGLNVLPATQAAGMSLLKAVSSEDQFANLKTIIAPATTSRTDITMFVGPQLNLVLTSLDTSKVILTWFVGGTLKF